MAAHSEEHAVRRRWFISCLVQLAICGAIRPASAAAVGQPRADQLISWFIIGFSENNPATRNVGWGLARTGWEPFVKQRVEPQVRWGVRRVMLHNPFGALGGEDMQFSQLQQARKQDGLERLTDRDAFVRAWKPLTEKGVEVIAYLGSPSGNDVEYKPLLQKGTDADRRTLEEACLEPLLAAGMSIALDAASAQDERSATFALAKRLRGRGVKVYIEALPSNAAKHWHDYPAMCTMWFWNNPDRSTWGVTETKAGTTLLLADSAGATTWSEWDAVFEKYRGLMSAGRSLAVGATDIEILVRSRVSIDRLLSAK